MSWPTSPVAAATHSDPYPYYAELARGRPLYRDDELGLWVASSAVTVEAVLTSGLCRVRPAGQPVPPALLGTTAGELFGRLTRMMDGEAHPPLKRAVSAALGSVDPARIASLAAEWAALLWERDEGTPASSRARALAFDLSPHVLGSLLGISRDQVGQVATWMADFVRCLAPASTPEQVARGIAVAEDLAGLVMDLLHTHVAGRPGDLLAALRREIEGVGVADEAVVVANGIGFLSQAYEATAGLIGNALLALAADLERDASTVTDPSRARRVVRETLRRDPPIQSTRRFVDREATIAGQAVREGDAILVLLSAANHDPALQLNQPGDDGCGYALGAGAHVCPGGGIAVAIAEAAVRQVIASGVDLTELAASFSYRPSANARIPMFGAKGASA